MPHLYKEIDYKLLETMLGFVNYIYSKEVLHLVKLNQDAGLSCPHLHYLYLYMGSTKCVTGNWPLANDTCQSRLFTRIKT